MFYLIATSVLKYVCVSYYFTLTKVPQTLPLTWTIMLVFVIESSVHLQWTRPSYTGGVDVMNYTISANGRRLEVMDDSETVSYTTSGLVYGEVQVSAINTCGQESQPATINVPCCRFVSSLL